MKKLFRFVLLLCIIGFIFYMSSQDAVRSNLYNEEIVNQIKIQMGVDLYSSYGKDTVDIVVRKLGHFGEFAFLCAASYMVLGCIKVRRVFISTIVISVLFGAFDELHQLFVTGRSPSVFDTCIDAAGVVVMASIIALFKMIKLEISNGANRRSIDESIHSKF